MFHILWCVVKYENLHYWCKACPTFRESEPLGLASNKCPGMLEQWNIGILGSMGGTRLLLDGLWSERSHMLYITHYSITPIRHRLVSTWRQPYGVKPVPGPLDPGIYFQSVFSHMDKMVRVCYGSSHGNCSPGTCKTALAQDHPVTHI